MCTVTVIATRDPGYRLVTNRDVDRARAEAHPPAWRRDLARRAVWPTDADAGGTWVAASESGLTLCLLNKNPEPSPALPPDLASRGLIIPALIESPHAEAAVDALGAMDLRAYAPFRLVGCDLVGGVPRVLEADWNLRELRVAEHETPVCFVSSGLGDSRVLPRLPLFDERVRDFETDGQDAFHRHAWPGRPEISVLMSRPDARTVSISTVDMGPSGATPRLRFTYEPTHETAGVHSA